jgi:hypothetical protein
MESPLRQALSKRASGGRRRRGRRANGPGRAGGRAGRSYPRARVWHVSVFHSSLSFLSNFLSILPNPKDLGKN